MTYPSKPKHLRRPVLGIDDIRPDGVIIHINWDLFVIGSSFFIPCIDIEKAYYDLSAIAKRKNINITKRVKIENGLYGLRVWRTE